MSHPINIEFERRQHDIVYRTGIAEPICRLLMDYALWRIRATTAAQSEETEPELELEPGSEPAIRAGTAGRSMPTLRAAVGASRDRPVVA